MMKKTFIGSRLLAVVLTLAMVLSFAGVLPLGITASAADPSFDGYIYNGDFETGTASPWKLNSGSSIVTGGHNGSGYAVRFQSSNAWSYFYQKVNIQPDTDYRVTFWVKRVAGTSSHNIYIYDPNDTNNIRPGINGTKQWFNYTSDEWVKHVFEFNSGTLTTVGIYFKNSTADDVFLYDDITLKALPKPSFDGYIYNGDFETGDAAPWTPPAAASIVAGGHDGSDYCARLAASAPDKQWEHIKQEITVEPNTDYRLSGWVKREAGTGAHYLYAQGPGNEKLSVLNDCHQWFTYANQEWTQHIWEFNSGAFSTIKLYMMIEDPASVFLYDDITLEKLATANTDGYITNGDFETGVGSGWVINSASAIIEGGRNDSDYALKLAGSAGQNARQAIIVEGMTDFRLTVYAKRLSGTGAHAIFAQKGDTVLEPINGTEGIVNGGDEWTEYVYEFNSTAATQVTIFLQVTDPGTVFLYDDVKLEKLTGPDYSDVLKGDVDLDGELTNEDATLIEQHIAGETTLEDAAAYAADMDCDGEITETDLAMLRSFISGEASAVPLYPINGETVAKGSWQIEELLVDYTPGKSDSYSGLGSRKDQYMRDPVVLRWKANEGGARSYNVLVADNYKLENAKRYLIQTDGSSEKTLSIQNLMVDTDYYWAIDLNGKRSEVGTFHTAKTVRTFWFEGVSNTRDLGGWLTEDGLYRVKYNVAFRGAKFDDVTEEGKQAITDLGIKTDVDLRTHNEGVQAPLADIGVEWFLAGHNGAAMYYSTEASTISDLTSSYVAGTINAVRVYADSTKFPAYFHCSYGRDRTGTLGLMLLGLLGVGRNDILADYEMTFLSEWGGGNLSASGHTRLLINTMDWLQETYAPEGTLKEAVEGYLLAAGLTADEISAIRANMLERVGEEPEATGIEVTMLPDKTSYLEGKDEFDVTGAKLTVYYDDDSFEEIDITADMVSGFDNTVVGPQTLTVTYGEFTATFEIEITAKSLTRIDITGLPDTLDYIEGEEFDPAGLEITAYYDNETSEVLAADAYTLEGFESTVGEHVITVSYGGKTTAFTVNVAAKTLESIKVTAFPNKLEYVEGEEFDATGIEVTAYYDNKTSEVLAADAYTLEGFESTVGEHVITVTYGEKTDAFTVTVIKKAIPGDIDGDGEISVSDALMALRVAAKLATFEDEALFALADVDHDGEITVSDVLRILRVAAKLADPSTLA